MLFRDCSTFEANFGKNDTYALKNKIDLMHEEIGKTFGQIKNLKRDESAISNSSAWLTEN